MCCLTGKQNDCVTSQRKSLEFQDIFWTTNNQHCHQNKQIDKCHKILLWICAKSVLCARILSKFQLLPWYIFHLGSDELWKMSQFSYFFIDAFSKGRKLILCASIFISKYQMLSCYLFHANAGNLYANESLRIKVTYFVFHLTLLLGWFILSWLSSRRSCTWCCVMVILPSWDRYSPGQWVRQ